MKNELKESCIEFAKNPITDGIAWKDVTTYSRSDVERIPSVFRVEIGGCTISIISGHIYYPNSWIMNCNKLGVKEVLLKCVKAEDAARLSIDYCKNIVSDLYKAFNSNI